MAADRAEGVAVLHIVEHDLLRKLPSSPWARAAVFAALRVWIVAALGVRVRGGREVKMIEFR